MGKITARAFQHAHPALFVMDAVLDGRRLMGAQDSLEDIQHMRQVFRDNKVPCDTTNALMRLVAEDAQERRADVCDVACRVHEDQHFRRVIDEGTQLLIFGGGACVGLLA